MILPSGTVPILAMECMVPTVTVKIRIHFDYRNCLQYSRSSAFSCGMEPELNYQFSGSETGSFQIPKYYQVTLDSSAGYGNGSFQFLTVPTVTLIFFFQII